MIQAKILNVLSSRDFAINAGKKKGVAKSMKFKVINGTKVKAIIEISEVFEAFSLAEKIDFKGANQSPEKIDIGDDVIEVLDEPNKKILGGFHFFRR
jgi:hypothetical protein